MMRPTLFGGLCATMVCVLFTVGFARAEEAKLPESLAELNAWYVEPAKDQNAATYFLKAFASLKNVINADPVLPWIGDRKRVEWLGKSIPPALGKAIAGVLADNEAAIQTFKEGARFTECRYPVDLSIGYSGTLPHLSKVKTASKFLGLRALWLAEKGQADEAGETLLLMLALERSLQAEPLNMSQLVRSACISYAEMALEDVVNKVSLSPRYIDQIEREFDRIEANDAKGVGYARALIAERVFCQHLFDLPLENQKLMFGFLTNGTPAEIESLLQKTRDSKELDFLDKGFGKLQSIWIQDYPHSSGVHDFCAAQVAQATEQNYFLSKWLMNAFPVCFVREVRGLANVRLARTALALERYRLSHRNVYPDLLSELVPKYLSVLPQDPANGKPMQYRKVRKGYTLVSVGFQDLISARAKKEIAFTVIAPAKN